MPPKQQSKLTGFFTSTPAPPKPAVEKPIAMPSVPPPATLEPVVNLTTSSPPPVAVVGTPPQPAPMPRTILPTATAATRTASLPPPVMTTTAPPPVAASAAALPAPVGLPTISAIHPPSYLPTAAATTTSASPPVFDPATALPFSPPSVRAAPLPFLYSNTRPPPHTNRRLLYDLIQLLPTHYGALESHLRTLPRTTTYRSPIRSSMSIGSNGTVTHHGPPLPDLDELPVAEVKSSLLAYCQSHLNPTELAPILTSNLLTPTPAEQTIASYKRALEEEDSDEELTYTWNCNQVRRRIHAFLESGEMKVTEFQRLLGVNSNSYRRFMGFNGAWQGVDNGTMAAAYRFFRKREAEGKAIKKKAKTTSGVSPYSEMIRDVHLDGEDEDAVKVYESCDEVRKKISAHLRKSDVTQAQFLKDMAAQFRTSVVKIQSKQLNDFRNKSGADAGNTSRVFYGAYVFFEKLRIKEGKAKSKHRLEMEKMWGSAGFDTKHSSSKGVWCAPGEVPVMNRLGGVEFYSPAPRPR